MSIKSLLNQTCTITTITNTVDAIGGVSESEASTATGVLCRVRPMSATERIIAGREDKQSTHRIYILPPSGWSFEEGNSYIDIGSDRYDINDIRIPSKTDHHREVDCTLRNG